MTGVPSSQVSLHGEYGAPILEIVHLSFRFTCWICIYIFGNLMFHGLVGRKPYRLYEYPQPPCFYICLFGVVLMTKLPGYIASNMTQCTLCHSCTNVCRWILGDGLLWNIPLLNLPKLQKYQGYWPKVKITEPRHRTRVGFQLLGWIDHDGCHTGQEMSLFPEHPISLPMGSSWFHPFIVCM